MPDLTPYAIAVVGITSMLMLWLLVQRAWGHVFDVSDGDVLEVRADCGGCAHASCTTTTCAARDGQ